MASYGAIHPMELAAGQKYTVDSGHLVTFEDRLDFRVRKVAGWKSTLFSGEGLVVDLTGPGKLTLQTRSEDAFLSWLIPQLPEPERRDRSSINREGRGSWNRLSGFLDGTVRIKKHCRQVCSAPFSATSFSYSRHTPSPAR